MATGINARVFRCEVCGKTYLNRKEAEECEDRHASEAKMGRTTIVVIHPRVVDIDGYAQYLGMCKQAARQFGKEAGAIVGVHGKKTLYDLRKTDEYLDAM